MPWKKNRDPLFRGDSRGRVSLPEPAANAAIVAHILYLGGPGRATQYHSLSEQRNIAERFAGTTGRVYTTTAARASACDVAHIGRIDLLRVLRGKGQGRAKWKSSFEVMQARRYVEQWAEHLLDFSKIETSSVASVVSKLYDP